MSTDAFLLVIAGALFHAAWNLCAKKASGGLSFVWLFGIVSLVAVLPFGLASWHAHPSPLGLSAWAAIAGSALIHMLYSLVLQQGYRAGDFSVVYPLARGTGPLFAVFGAILLLGEMPTTQGWLGIAAILLGILLISGAIRQLSTSAKALAGMYWGCLTGVFIAAYTVLDGWAIKVAGLDPVLYYLLVLMLRTAILAPQALGNPQALRQQWRSNRRYIIAVGLLSPLAYTLVLLAMVRAPLSYVAPVRELSMLVGVILGARLLRESFSPGRAIGTLLMVAGVAMLVRAP